MTDYDISGFDLLHSYIQVFVSCLPIIINMDIPKSTCPYAFMVGVQCITWTSGMSRVECCMFSVSA